MGRSPVQPLGSTVFLHPGEILMTGSAVSIKTVLGSCLAITMRAPRVGLASIAHCLLPSAGGAFPPAERNAPRYVDATIYAMLRTFEAKGVARNELEIKLFGGAGVTQMGTYGVGPRNVETAQSVLARYGIAVAASATGGRCGMAIQFDTGSGEVLVRRLPPTGGLAQ